MVRHLLVVRHAKSDWGDSETGDHQRPLSARGLAATAGMCAHLATRPAPDLVLCSTARRTVETLDGIRPGLADGVDVSLEDELYLASAGELLERLRRVDDDVGAAMVIGHNPGMQRLTLGLAGTGDVAVLERAAAKFPTGAMATLSFDGDWPGLDAGSCHLDELFTPRPPR